jgi:hypothetical protein
MFLDKPRDLWRDRNSRLGARTSYARTSDDRKKGEQFKLMSQHLFAVFACPRPQTRACSELASPCPELSTGLKIGLRLSLIARIAASLVLALSVQNLCCITGPSYGCPKNALYEVIEEGIL